MRNDWIRAAREKRNLSQAKLAKLLGLKQHILSEWELSKDSPSPSQIENVKRVLAQFDLDLQTGQAQAFLQKRRQPKNRFDASLTNPALPQNQPARAARKNRARKNEYADSLFKLNQSSQTTPYSALALFSGCGGLSLGFRWAGLKIIGFVEKEPSARAMYQANFPASVCLGTDIREISDAHVAEWRQRFGAVNVLFGGPPCQGFSLAGKRDVYDPRNQLYREFVRIAGILKPDVILMENVRLLTSMRAPDRSLISDHVLEDFDRVGYRSKFQTLNAQNYGVPQFRERVFFIGIRRDFSDAPIVFPKITHENARNGSFDSTDQCRTFRDATGDLQALESGQASNDDAWHFAPRHPPHIIEMLREIPEGASAHNHPNPNLRPSSGYNTTYKRLCWDEPCSTIGTNFGMISGSRNVHPADTRSLTIREALRCQSFPDDFKLGGTLGQIRTAIGNSVPPLLAKAIAEHLAQFYLAPVYSSQRARENNRLGVQTAAV